MGGSSLRYRSLLPLFLAVACLAVVLAGVASQPDKATPGPPGPKGVGVCITYGQDAGQELSELAVSWYVDWSFTTPDVPSYGRLYVVSPRSSLPVLAQAVAKRRGAWWAMGNEPNDPYQDNQTPAEHAAFFHTAEQTIRKADPSARIVSAGIANADWRWADAFRHEYKMLTGAYPRLDAWNIHNYI